MGKLSNYANASAGKKEDRIFTVSSMVQSSSNNYAIQDVLERVGVEIGTVYGYLTTILKANSLDMRYLGRLRKPFEETWIAKNSTDELSLTVGRSEYERWQAMAEEVQDLPDAQKDSLNSYIFEDSRAISRPKRYEKLEMLLLQATILKSSK